jgi:hypothetical protein
MNPVPAPDAEGVGAGSAFATFAPGAGDEGLSGASSSDRSRAKTSTPVANLPGEIPMAGA